MTTAKNRAAKPGKRIDLNAAHKARAEKRAAPPVVLLGDQEFTLPSSLPALAIVGLARTRQKDDDGHGSTEGLEECFTALFGDRADEVLKLGLELDDLELIFEEAYGEDPGESSASGS